MNWHNDLKMFMSFIEKTCRNTPKPYFLAGMTQGIVLSGE